MKLEKLKNDLKNYKKDILDKNIEITSLEDIKSWSTEKWTEELMNTLCFSFSGVIEDFICENKEENCFKSEIENSKFNGNIEKYVDYVVDGWKIELPFSYREPEEFFNALNGFAEELIEELKDLKTE